MPEYAVARDPFQAPENAPMLRQVLYGILNALYGSEAIQDAPLDMMMPLGGMAVRGGKGLGKVASLEELKKVIKRINERAVNPALHPSMPGSTAVGKKELDQLFSAFKKQPFVPKGETPAELSRRAKQGSHPTREEVERELKKRGIFWW